MSWFRPSCLQALLMLCVAGFGAFLTPTQAQAESSIVTTLKAMTRLDVEMQGKDSSFWRRSVKINGLRFFNADDLDRSVMVDIPQVRVRYRLGPLLLGRIHLSHVAVDVEELVVIRHPDGKLNIHALGGCVQDCENGLPSIKIDELELNIRKITYYEHLPLEEIRVTTLDINQAQHAENIRNPEEVLELLRAQAEFHTQANYSHRLDAANATPLL